MFPLILEGLFFMMAVRLLCSLSEKTNRYCLHWCGCWAVHIQQGASQSCGELPVVLFNSWDTFTCVPAGKQGLFDCGDHPLISAVEVNYLPSNDPNEVRSVWRLLCSDRQRRYDVSRAVREELMLCHVISYTTKRDQLHHIAPLKSYLLWDTGKPIGSCGKNRPRNHTLTPRPLEKLRIVDSFHMIQPILVN